MVCNDSKKRMIAQRNTMGGGTREGHMHLGMVVNSRKRTISYLTLYSSRCIKIMKRS